MARPLNPDSGRLDIRADPAELRAWAAAAAAEDRSLSSWLKQVANKASGYRATKKRPEKRAVSTG